MNANRMSQAGGIVVILASVGLFLPHEGKYQLGMALGLALVSAFAFIRIMWGPAFNGEGKSFYFYLIGFSIVASILYFLVALSTV